MVFVQRAAGSEKMNNTTCCMKYEGYDIILCSDLYHFMYCKAIEDASEMAGDDSVTD